MDKINARTLKEFGTYIGLIEAVGYVYHMPCGYYSFNREGVKRLQVTL